MHMRRDPADLTEYTNRLRLIAVLLLSIVLLASCSLNIEVTPDGGADGGRPGVTAAETTFAPTKTTRDPAYYWPTSEPTDLDSAKRWATPSTGETEPAETESLPSETKTPSAAKQRSARSSSTPYSLDIFKAHTDRDDGPPDFKETTKAGDKALEESLLYLKDRTLFEEAFNYLTEVAFSPEYNDDGTKALKRWHSPIRLHIVGDCSDENLAVIDRLIDWLSRIDGMPEIICTEEDSNHSFHFVPLDEMSLLIDNFPEDNWGIAWVYWSNFDIEQGLCAVASDMMTEEEMTHIIQEEFIQSLGLLNDSYTYPDSIFQQHWTVTQHPSALDFALIRMLYGPAITPGMDPEDAYDALVSYYFPPEG